MVDDSAASAIPATTVGGTTAVPVPIPGTLPLSVSAPINTSVQQGATIPHPGITTTGAMQPTYAGLAPTMMMQPPPGAGVPGVAAMPGAGIPGARVAQMQHHQSQAELNAKLQSFWNDQMEEVQLAHDFKNHLLPLARIKKIMKSDEDVRMISAEAPVLFAKACEMFILELTHRAWAQTEEAKRRTLQRSDISTAIQKTDIFDFLIDIVPRDDPKKEHGVGVMNTAAMPGNITNLGNVGGANMAVGAIAGAQAMDPQSQMQYYMGNHAPYPGSTDPAAAAAAAGMMYAQPNQYAATAATAGYAAGLAAHYGTQYMRGGQQHAAVMYAPQQTAYNQQYLAGNTAAPEASAQPPPSQS